MRRITTLAVTAAMAGGLLFAAAPAQAVTASAKSGAATRGVVICDYNKMRAQVADLRQKAAQLDHLGAHAEAKKARAQADALQRRIQACLDAENNA
ncbi:MULTISPECIES: hypothetical protein [unclassified Streptomyces]|uniref:hypothetical protein n=1 Tax=unclassified Streptomyces TaxID=2593676 RepID=UPI002DDC66B8|nr:hypothetical protein [Streptomyces sp. NBC_01750]WSD36496.1 hypothetical protein OG966_34065 [Streptomyces sp. NBC_01750]